MGEKISGEIMSYEKMDGGELNYEPCHYGESRLSFRGPKKSLEDPFLAFLGGTETYGKFVEQPFVDLLDAKLPLECVNLGYLNAGIDAFLAEPTVLDMAQRAEATVIQVMGAHNMSNRYYKVHPRRNDRFIGASNMMQMVFNEIDFSEFHFTRHMLSTLCARTPDRYAMVRDELRMAWSARMKLLINTIGGKIILLWVADHAPETAMGTSGLGPDPLFVDRLMIEELRPLVDDVVEVVLSEDAVAQGAEGMRFSDMERMMAQRMLSVKGHEETAAAMFESLQRMVSAEA